MSFVTGLILIDAPASALNNSGSVQDELYGNKVAVKAIRHGGRTYPYVSAQAFRYWLRTTLERGNYGWKEAPIYREEKVAYTDANPIKWWDDDLFGYMRSPKTGNAAKKQRKEDPEYQKLTPLEIDRRGNEQTITRVSPFRVSTLVSIEPAQIVEDWESMSRLEGEAVPYSNQFYRATLRGLFSLDLHASGTFSYLNKTGYRNLDSVRQEQARQEPPLEHLELKKSYRLPLAARITRISALFEGLAHLEGGAKQTLHYTDVAPALLILAVTRGGNHIFGHTVGADSLRLPELKIEALHEALTVCKNEILSTVYVGWIKGFLDEQRGQLESALAAGGMLEHHKAKLVIDHPRVVLSKFIEDIRKPENSHWLD